MIGAGEEELICDFAETYHIHDYRSLPASRAAILACGLRDDSRIMMKMRGEKLTLTETLIAGMIDEIALIVAWLSGTDKTPESILEKLNGSEQEKEKDSDRGISGFDTPDELNEKLRELRGEN